MGFSDRACGLNGLCFLGTRPVSAAWPVFSGLGPGTTTRRRVNLQPYGMSMRSFFCHPFPLTSFGLRFWRRTLADVPVTRCWRPMRQCTHRPSSRILKRLRAPWCDLSFCLRGLSTRRFLRGAPIVWAVMERVAILGASGAPLTSEPKAGAAHSGERWTAMLMRVRVATAGRVSVRETSSVRLASVDRQRGASLAGCCKRRNIVSEASLWAVWVAAILLAENGLRVWTVHVEAPMDLG